MSDVIFTSSEYDDPGLRSTVYDMLDALGGDRIRKNSRVLIKPNLLAPAKPEQGIQTHPMITWHVAQYVLAKGASVRISDSPAIGSFENVLKTGGYHEAFGDLNVVFKPFKTGIKKDIGTPYGEIHMARAPLEADMVINLAKLKTHGQMLLTLGVKNLFGCIIGTRKPEWHMRCGVSRETFAALLVQIYQAIQPAITLVDGILALEGEGPGKSGTPRHLGVLVGGTNALGVDQAICGMLDIHPDRLPTHRAARRLGVADPEVHVTGTVARITDFRFPVLGPLAFGPHLFQRIIRKHMIQRPVVDPAACRTCGKCWEYCPANAIRQNGHTIHFQYDRCIRCYCCVEICPHGALRTEETLPGKMLRGLQTLWEKHQR